MKEIHIHLHHHGDPRLESIEATVAQILTNTEQIMASVAELGAQVTELRAAIDAEQVEIADAFAALDAKIVDLTARIVDGGTPEERQAISDELTAAVADVKSTVTAAAPAPPTP